VTRRFLRFATIGGFGFVVDVAVLYAAMAALGVGPYLGRVVSFLAAVSFTWWFNRRYTFRPSGASWAAEWGRFASVNLVGGLINYATYAALVGLHQTFAAYPFLAVAAGSGTGLLVNFFASSRFVFDHPTRAERRALLSAQARQPKCEQFGNRAHGP
jgi:putative flippase GtrA